VEDFPPFAQKFTEYGSPFRNLVELTDGNFLRVARPGGSGSSGWVAKLDQGVVYNRKEKSHGLEFLAVLFPNEFVFCMVLLKVPCMTQAFSVTSFGSSYCMIF
jgi:hypothetical protein